MHQQTAILFLLCLLFSLLPFISSQSHMFETNAVTFTRVPSGATPPSNWTCNASYYKDGVCDCLCGASDPDCYVGGKYTIAVNCPCASMTCPNTYCYGVCNLQDYNYLVKDFHNYRIVILFNSLFLALALVVILGLVCIRWVDEETISLSRELQKPIVEQRKIASENEALKRLAPRKENKLKKTIRRVFYFDDDVPQASL